MPDDYADMSASEAARETSTEQNMAAFSLNPEDLASICQNGSMSLYGLHPEIRLMIWEFLLPGRRVLKCSLYEPNVKAWPRMRALRLRTSQSNLSCLKSAKRVGNLCLAKVPSFSRKETMAAFGGAPMTTCFSWIRTAASHLSPPLWRRWMASNWSATSLWIVSRPWSRSDKLDQAGAKRYHSGHDD